MGKEILIISATYMDLKISSNNRSNYIPELLHNNGYTVELLTSNFSHHRKQHVSPDFEQRPYKVTMIPELGYTKNVSLKRLISIFSLGIGMKKYLSTRTKPNIVYVFVPPMNIANIARKYALKNKVRFIIDIRDLWPEAFQMIFHVPIISNLIFWPFKQIANAVYKSADEIIGVSDTYRDRGLSVNKKVKQGYTIYLGTNLSDFDNYAHQPTQSIQNLNGILLAYVGTLGNSYDLHSTFYAMQIIMNAGYSNVKLLIFGSGPLENKFKKLAVDLGINVHFYGRLPYSEMVPLLIQCDIALNPINKGAAQSIINKHADYAAAGLPVVNTQECLEYRDMIEKYNIGTNCINNDSTDMANKILFLADNPELRKVMGKNHRRLAEDKFDREKTYPKLLDIIK